MARSGCLLPVQVITSELAITENTQLDSTRLEACFVGQGGLRGTLGIIVVIHSIIDWLMFSNGRQVKLANNHNE